MANESSIIRGTCFYKGHSVKGNFNVQLKLGFTEEHVKEAIQFIAGIGRNLALQAKVDGSKLSLGTWNVFKVVVDKDLQGTVILNSTTDYVDMDAITPLVTEDMDITLAAQIKG